MSLPAPRRTTFPRTARPPRRRLLGLELGAVAAAALLPPALSASAPDLALAALARLGAAAVVAAALRAAKEPPLHRGPFVAARSGIRIAHEEQPEALRKAPRGPRTFVDTEREGVTAEAIVVTEIEARGWLG